MSTADRRKVRAQASKTSSEQRKSTIAWRSKHRPLNPVKATRYDAVLSQAQKLCQHLAQPRSAVRPNTSDGSVQADFDGLCHTLEALQSQQHWLTQALGETNLAQQAIRSELAGVMVSSPAVLQSTLFLAGTYSNTCGLSYKDVHFGVGMAFMRGVSLAAVKQAIAASESESWLSVAMAVLAGWELYFGDQESFQIHMKACNQVWGTGTRMRENDVATLCEAAFETMRQQLNDVSHTAPAFSPILSQNWAIPQGFDVFAITHSESKSLFHIACEAIHFDPRPKGAVEQIRGLALQTLSWTPHHRTSVKPTLTFEGNWDALELNALLHVRAAVLSIVALHSHICHTMHQAVSYLVIMQAADVHAHSCSHLRTHDFIGTKYQYAAVWARVTVASISCSALQDPTQRETLSSALAALYVHTWPELEALMRDHILLDTFWESSRDLFEALSAPRQVSTESEALV